MSFLTGLIKELRDRKLWPIAIGLIVALARCPCCFQKAPDQPDHAGAGRRPALLERDQATGDLGQDHAGQLQAVRSRS